MKFPEKNESGFVFGAHRTQLPQFFATSPNVATLLARTAVRSVRNVQIASQHKMMRIQMAFFFSFEKATTVLYNASVASFAPGPKCFIQHLHRATAPVQTITLRTVGRMAITVEITLLSGQTDRQMLLFEHQGSSRSEETTGQREFLSRQYLTPGLYCTPRTRTDGIITLTTVTWP